MRGLFATILGSNDDGFRPSDPNDRRFWNNSGSRSMAGPRVTPDLAVRVSTVYAAVNLLARVVATLPLRMYRVDSNGNEFEAPNHPLNELLEFQPNTWQTAWDFKAMLMSHLALRGNGYAEILPGPRGAVDRLEPIHPDRVTVERLTDGTLRYTIVDQNNQLRRLVQDEVFHIRTAYAPGLVGISPIAYAKETIGLAMAAEEHGARTFSGGARPSGIVQLKGKLSDAAFKRFKEDFNKNFAGVHNSGKTPILEEGGEFKPVTMSADEVQFLQTRQFQIEEIARWFDVPLVMLHHMTNQTSWGTGLESVMRGFVRNNLMPWLTAWTQAIRRDLIIAPSTFKARFDVETLQQGDSQALSNFITRLVLNGVLTRNEGRQIIGYNPLEGLDEPLVPTNTTTPDNMPTPGQQPPGSALMGRNGGPALDDDTQIEGGQ